MATTNETRTNLREKKVISNLMQDENTKQKIKYHLQIGMNFCFIFLVVGSIIEKSDPAGFEAVIFACFALIICFMSFIKSIFWPSYEIKNIHYFFLIIKHSSVIGSIAISLDRGNDEAGKSQNYYLLCISVVSAELQMAWESLHLPPKIIERQRKDKSIIWITLILYQVISQVSSLLYNTQMFIQSSISIVLMIVLLFAEKYGSLKSRSQLINQNFDDQTEEQKQSEFEIKHELSILSENFPPSPAANQFQQRKRHGILRSVTSEEEIKTLQNNLGAQQTPFVRASTQQQEIKNCLNSKELTITNNNQSNTTNYLSNHILGNVNINSININNNNNFTVNSGQQSNQNINFNINSSLASQNINSNLNSFQRPLIQPSKIINNDEGYSYQGTSANCMNTMGFSNMGFLKPTQSRLLKKSSILSTQDLSFRQNNQFPFFRQLPFSYAIFSQQEKEISIVETNTSDFTQAFMEELVIDELNIPLSRFIKMRFDPKYSQANPLHKFNHICTHSRTTTIYKMLVQPNSNSVQESQLTPSQQPLQKLPSIAVSQGIKQRNPTTLATNLLSLFFIEVTEIIPQNTIQNQETTQGIELASYKQDLLATVSHDLKNLLNGMIQVLDLCSAEWYQIKDSIQMQKMGSLITLAQKSSQLLLFLVYDIQDFHLQQKKKLRLRSEEVNIEQLMEEIKGLFQQQVQVKGIQLRFNSKIENSVIYTDGLRLKQVLINLVSNAIKYTSKGEVSMILTEGPKTGLAQVTISDTGSGIPERILKELFQVYQTFDHQEGQNARGVGLGLVISQKIVEEMGPAGQHIEVRSVQGKGTTFSFCIYQKLHEKQLINEIKPISSRNIQSHFSLSIDSEGLQSPQNNCKTVALPLLKASPINQMDFNTNNLKVLGFQPKYLQYSPKASNYQEINSICNSNEDLKKNALIAHIQKKNLILSKCTSFGTLEGCQSISDCDNSIDLPSSTRFALPLSQKRVHANHPNSPQYFHPGQQEIVNAPSIFYSPSNLKYGEQIKSFDKIQQSASKKSDENGQLKIDFERYPRIKFVQGNIENVDISKSINLDSLVQQEIKTPEQNLLKLQRLSDEIKGKDEEALFFKQSNNNQQSFKQHLQFGALSASVLKKDKSMKEIEEFSKTDSQTTIPNADQLPNLQSSQVQKYLSKFNTQGGGSTELHNSSNVQKMPKKKLQRRISTSFFINNRTNSSTIGLNFPSTISNEEFAQKLISIGIKKIMIVDDEPLNIFVMSETLRFLEQYGLTLQVAHSGVQAIEESMKENGSFQLLFIDSNMPEITGLEALQEIKKINPTLIAIIVSGDARHEEVALAEAGGADGFLSKPTQLAHIKTLLSQICAKFQFCQGEQED